MEPKVQQAFDAVTKELNTLDELQMYRNVAISQATNCNTPESMARLRRDITKDSDYWSLPFEDVCRAVRREMKLLDERDELLSQVNMLQIFIEDLVDRSTSIISQLDALLGDSKIKLPPEKPYTYIEVDVVAWGNPKKVLLNTQHPLSNLISNLCMNRVQDVDRVELTWEGRALDPKRAPEFYLLQTGDRLHLSLRPGVGG